MTTDILNTTENGPINITIKQKLNSSTEEWQTLSSSNVSSSGVVELEAQPISTEPLQITYSNARLGVGGNFKLKGIKYQRKDILVGTKIEMICNTDPDFNTDYRYGFNGQEKVNEIAGKGNHNTALFWDYDTRLGRRWNVDPVKKEYESSYACFGNSPISVTDVLGDDSSKVNKKIEVDPDGSGYKKGYKNTFLWKFNEKVQSIAKHIYFGGESPTANGMKALFGVDPLSGEKVSNAKRAVAGVVYLSSLIPFASTINGTGKVVITITNQSATKTNAVLNTGSASAFFKVLNPQWNGALTKVTADFSTTSFTALNGVKVILSTTSKSNGMATIKLIQADGYQLILRFPKF